MKDSDKYKLLYSLMDMVSQHFSHTKDNKYVYHSCMTADEDAIDVLIQFGVAEEIRANRYKLLWDKLEELK